MPRGRIACWKAPDAEEAPQVLAAILQGHVKTLVKVGDDLYGTCFALKHLDGSQLDRWGEMLAALRKVDPRGCYVAQEEMLVALIICVDAEKLQAEVAQQAERLAISQGGDARKAVDHGQSHVCTSTIPRAWHDQDCQQGAQKLAE